MRLSIGTLCILAALLFAGNAAAQVSVGLAAPLTGPSAILGQQMRTGASLAAETLAVRLTVADDGCTADGGARAARELVAAGVQIVVGFLCGEAIEAALPILKQANIPTITVGVRTDSLTDRKNRTGWLVYRLGPRADSEREAAGRLLTRLWQKELFAIVDDGTIYGRELSESLRGAAEQAGLSPVFVDTFRPQLDNQIGLVGRLRQAGATHVFAAGERDDIAIIGRDAAQLQAGLTVAGGEALRSPGEIPLAAGTLMVALPEWPDLALPEVAKAFADRRLLDQGYVLPAYAAVEIAHAALGGSAPPATNLSGRDFATAIGTIRFDDKGDLTENPYRLFRYDGANFSEVAVPLMFKTGPLNLITDVAGLRVGNVADEKLKSGVTVVLCDAPAVAGVQVLDGAPGTRETDLLEPHMSVETVNAIVLSGGSAFGLDAASGVQAALREQGVGFQVRGNTIPIVPAAILFDLANGGDKNWGRYPPYREMGYDAVQAAAREFQIGTAGAGTGALTAGLKGGLGSASTVLDSGIRIGALAAVNPTGSVTVGRSRHFWASPFEIGDEFGDQGYPSPLPVEARRIHLKFRDKHANTTIAVIATDAVLTPSAAKRLAIASHDGFARAIWPTHTPADGDLVFALATGASGRELSGDDAIDLFAAAGATMARAIARGVYAATPAPNDLFPVWSSRRV